jgi:NDP-sugar pyrophosphorylase family protein
MVNIIPLAGLGSRFSEEGYLLPKPLIPVSGLPMIVSVIRRIPRADKWIFLVRKEHVEQFAIDKVIKREVPDAVIIEIEKTTEGQASTCMLAIPHLKEDDEILISACDNGFLFSEEQFTALRKRTDVDSILWTFTKDTLLTDKPTAWGWVKTEKDGETIEDVSIKVPISAEPINDHAVVATFYFKRAGDFKAAYEKMVEENYRIRNEFYVDSMPIFLKKLGKKSVIFDVDLYVSFGKPADLHLYEYREFLNSQGKLADEKWKKYFT